MELRVEFQYFNGDDPPIKNYKTYSVVGGSTGKLGYSIILLHISVLEWFIIEYFLKFVMGLHL